MARNGSDPSSSSSDRESSRKKDKKERSERGRALLMIPKTISFNFFVDYVLAERGSGVSSKALTASLLALSTKHLT